MFGKGLMMDLRLTLQYNMHKHLGELEAKILLRLDSCDRNNIEEAIDIGFTRFANKLGRRYQVGPTRSDIADLLEFLKRKNQVPDCMEVEIPNPDPNLPPNPTPSPNRSTDPNPNPSPNPNQRPAISTEERKLTMPEEIALAFRGSKCNITWTPPKPHSKNHDPEPNPKPKPDPKPNPNPNPEEVPSDGGELTFAVQDDRISQHFHVNGKHISVGLLRDIQQFYRSMGAVGPPRPPLPLELMAKIRAEVSQPLELYVRLMMRRRKPSEDL